MDNVYFERILRCPACKEPLTKKGYALYCIQCETGYQEQDGLWDFLPPDSSSLKISEREHYTELTEYYIHMHNTWCESPFYRYYHHEFINDLLKLPRGSLLLELGCGLGHDGLELLRSGYRVVETDIAPGQLREAQRLHTESGYSDSCAHLLADAEYLPFASRSFDGALMVASLHHLPNPLRSLKEIRRILRPGGVFALGTEPNSWQSHTIYPMGKLVLRLLKRTLRRKIDPSEVVSEADKLTEGFSYSELNDLFREAGFDHWVLKPAGYLSAAISFISTDFSHFIGGNLRLFPLERVVIPLDEALGKLPLISRYPWHWNAVAHRRVSAC